MVQRGSRVLIIGGTRFIGRATAEAAVAAGAEVTLLNRGRTGGDWPALFACRQIHGDRHDEAVLARALAGGYDAVFDMIAYRPEEIRPLLAPPLAGSIGHLVVCSTTSVYAPAICQPIAEDHPRGPHPAWGEYNTGKNAVEDLLAAARGVRTTVLRPQWVFGPHDYQHLADFYLTRLAAGLPVPLWHAGVAQLNWTYVGDLAAAFLRVAGEAAASGRAFNIVCNETLTTTEFIGLCGRVLGVVPEVRPYDPDALPGELRGKRVGPVRDLPLACSSARFQDTFGLRPTSMPQGLVRTVDQLAASGQLTAVEPTAVERHLSGQA